MARDPIDQQGKRFGAWTVLCPGPKSNSGFARWMCRCDCGAEHIVLTVSLTTGASTRCRACADAANSGRSHHNFKHGRGYLYGIWKNMKTRCGNPNVRSFRDYGGRGITVCEQWKNDFSQFASDMGDRPSGKHQLDRIDNDAGYSPENCRWATKSENMKNTRRANHGVVFHDPEAGT